VAADEGHIYIYEQLATEVGLNYEYSYPMDLMYIFAGRVFAYQFF
jgi:hypothetical protein